MEGNKQDNYTEKTTVKEQIDNKNISDKQSPKLENIIHIKIENIQIFDCLKRTFNSLKSRYNLFCSNFLLLTQFLIFLLILSLFLFFSIFFYIILASKEYLNLIIFSQFKMSI